MMLDVYKKPTISLFDDIFGDFFNVSVVNAGGIKTPVHDVIENDKEYIVELFLPGIKKEDININVEKNVLIIKAERKEISDLNYNRKQSYFGIYEKSLVLSDDCDINNITSSLSEGILKINIPKLEAKIIKKIIEIM